jgi:hypothetical protein
MSSTDLSTKGLLSLWYLVGFGAAWRYQQETGGKEAEQRT